MGVPNRDRIILVIFVTMALPALILLGIGVISAALVVQAPEPAKAPEDVLDNGTTNGVIFIDSVGGKSFYTQDVRLGWAQCLDFCHRNGMQLASVTSMAQQRVLSNFLQSGRLSQISYFYMSGTDHLVENEWRWMISGDLITDAPWCEGHPRVDDRGWNCHAMNATGCWTNQHCGDLEPHRYIIGPLCEI